MAHGEFSTLYTSVFEFFKQHFESFLVTITFKAKWPRAFNCCLGGTVAWTGGRGGEWRPPAALLDGTRGRAGTAPSGRPPREAGPVVSLTFHQTQRATMRVTAALGPGLQA